MQKYTRNNLGRRRRPKSKKNRRIRKTRKYVVKGGKMYTEYYGVDDIYLFNPKKDIFGDDFSGTGTTKNPIYGLYTIETWVAKPRTKRAKELETENEKKNRTKGLIESVVEYVNKKNEHAFKNKNEKTVNYPFILSIPKFTYKDDSNSEKTLNEEIVPNPDSKESPDPILPEDFLRFNQRSDILNTLFPFFMKVYVSLLREINLEITETDENIRENRAKNQETMKFVLKTLREIHSFASPIWFSNIYNSFYYLRLNDYFKIAKLGYQKYMEKLSKSLSETNEIPIETTMYSFPSYGNCKDANCEPGMNKIIHTYLVKNGDYDKKEPIDSWLNMIFFKKDGNTKNFGTLTNYMKKGPLRSLEKEADKSKKPLLSI